MPQENEVPQTSPGISLELLDLFGGELLERSGFEREVPEPDFEWRDPK
jgi:hypothetical protein